MQRIFIDLGLLRTAMAAIVLVLLVSAPLALQPASTEGWPLLWTVVIPALFVIFIFVLPLDLVMTLVFMSAKEGEERARLKRVLIAESVLTMLLAAAWTPFIVSIASPEA